MKKFITIVLVLALSMSLISFARADEAEQPEVVAFQILPTPTPEPPRRVKPVATPEPDTFLELPDYDYASEDARCISRAIWSGTPANPTPKTRRAYGEIPQNMVDDGRYKESIRYTLLMDTEFPSYDPEAYRSDINNSIADYVMRSWMHAKLTGDRSYRLTPVSGIRYSFYNRDGWDYIIVYDWDWNIVYDSGE